MKMDLFVIYYLKTKNGLTPLCLLLFLSFMCFLFIYYYFVFIYIYNQLSRVRKRIGSTLTRYVMGWVGGIFLHIILRKQLEGVPTSEESENW